MRVWPFRPRHLLDQDVIDWMFDHVHWLLAHQAHRAAFASSVPLAISDRTFPLDGLSGHAAASRLLEEVQAYARMDHLRIRLTPTADSGRFTDGGSGHAPVPRMTAAGLYIAGDRRIEISYDASLLHRPAELAAVLAHEVSHAVLDLGADEAPASEALEMLTDLTATFLGFGFYLILLRSDTRIASPEVATEWRTLFEEYMSLRELCFATALHAELAGTDRSAILRHAGNAIGPDARAHLRLAFADLDRARPRVDALRAERAGVLGAKAARRFGDR